MSFSSSSRGSSIGSAVGTGGGTGGSSMKWVSVQHKSGGGGGGASQLVVNPQVAKEVFRPAGRNCCNLISVFGAARQGKSFLMNCLAGETELFKISNLRESCTQGLDISQNLMSLSDFSSLYGGKPVPGKRGVHVGLVDAEGQGDRDVTYDTNLICPVLLVSKCVIFNWKDSMQKDKILNQLGILHRAAINVVAEDEEAAAAAEEDHKLFGHLHLVFRDWQYEGSDEKSVFNDIFKDERSAETAAAVRNQIRRSIRENFESITIWLFPPPMKESSQLSTILSHERTQPAFKEKLSALRATLSSQLSQPTRFNGQELTGNNMGQVVETVAKLLNSGDAVRPKPAWVSMMCTEIEQSRTRFEAELREQMDAILAKYSSMTQVRSSKMSPSKRKSSGTGAGRRSSLGRSSDVGVMVELFPSRQAAHTAVEAIMQRALANYRSDVAIITGCEEGSNPSTLSAEDFATAESAKNKSLVTLLGYFGAKYNELFSTWIRNLKAMCTNILKEECDKLKTHAPFAPEDLESALSDTLLSLTYLFNDRLNETKTYRLDVVSDSTASNWTLDGSESEILELEDALKQIKHSSELQFELVRKNNADVIRATEDKCKRILQEAQTQLSMRCREVISSLESSIVSDASFCGVDQISISSKLDEVFKHLSDKLWDDTVSIPMGEKFANDMMEQLQKTGYDNINLLSDRYNEAMHSHISRVVREAIREVDKRTQHYLDGDSAVEEAQLAQEYQSTIQQVADHALSMIRNWSCTEEQRDAWLEAPLHQHCTQRFSTLSLVNKKMLDARTRELELRRQQAELRLAQEAALAAKVAADLRTKKRVSSPLIEPMEMDEDVPSASKRRRTMKFAAGENEDEEEVEQQSFQMECDFDDEDNSAPKKSEAKQKRAPRGSSSSSKQVEAASTEAATAVAKRGSATSLQEERRRAAEWAKQQQQAASKPPKKTPPLADSDDEGDSSITTGKKRGRTPGKASASKAITPAEKKLSKNEVIELAKQRAREAIEQRQGSRIKQLAEEQATNERDPNYVPPSERDIYEGRGSAGTGSARRRSSTSSKK